MRAWVSHSAGGPETLTLEEWARPAPADLEVVVRVQTVGINFPDGLFIRDLYQIKAPRPFIPGAEFCGVVADIGTGVTRLREGDVVVGVCGWGALADYIAVPYDRLIKIPDTLPRAEAAAFLFTYATAYHALHDAGRLRPGETLLVLGAAGGVGSAAVEVGVAMGAHVIAATSSQTKLDFAIARGATTGIVYAPHVRTPDDQRAFGRDLKQVAPDGIHVTVDPVGGGYTEPALRNLAGGGRHLVVGFTAGIPHVPTNLVLLKSSQIIGVDWRTFTLDHHDTNTSNVETLLEMWHDNKVNPVVTELFPFDAAPDAIACLESRRALGKIVVNVAPP